MAFVKGKLITVSELNNVNSSKSYYMSFGGDTKGWKRWPSDGGVYCRKPSGRLFRVIWKNSSFGVGNWELWKKEGNTWTLKRKSHYGWNTDINHSVNSYGEGWYRVHYEGKAGIQFWLYWAKSNNVKGHPLRAHTKGSTASLRGALLTADF